ncbi:MAG: redox-sensing transcriptional repressor Rex [Verrucomicrobiales bacterium]|nr:redox-sensing transcriptional repressor Rex [Verrucomicrobiales bacterium]|tara:strand:- start:1052 stop:1699 length:648 start_codon:yes stop_codon:yes gene_type:complete
MALKKNSKGPRPEIPRKTVYRLSIYNRCLQRLAVNGIKTVSSEALARAAGVKSTQLRKDLTYFGQFGTRGLGYEVEQLSQMIVDLLGTSSLQPVVLVGVGNLGRALLSYRGFQKEGFEVVGAFDIDPVGKGAKSPALEVLPMARLGEIARDSGVRLAIICVPPEEAQEVANDLVAAGVTGIMNFAPTVLQVPDEVMVNNVNLAIELENLSYFIQQ